MKSLIVESHAIALKALTEVSLPLLMDGHGKFVNSKGGGVSPLTVLKEHRIMQEALNELRSKFAYLMTNF